MVLIPIQIRFALCRGQKYSRAGDSRLLQFDGTPVDLSPRHVLRRVLKLYEERSWEPVIAPEMEFYIVDVNRGAEDLPLQPPIGRTGHPKPHAAYWIDAVNELEYRCSKISTIIAKRKIWRLTP